MKVPTLGAEVKLLKDKFANPTLQKAYKDYLETLEDKERDRELKRLALMPSKEPEERIQAQNIQELRPKTLIFYQSPIYITIPECLHSRENQSAAKRYERDESATEDHNPASPELINDPFAAMRSEKEDPFERGKEVNESPILREDTVSNHGTSGGFRMSETDLMMLI